MLLATTTVEEFDRFANVFSTGGAGKRAPDRDVPPIPQEAGHKGRPQVAELSGSYKA